MKHNRAGFTLIVILFVGSSTWLFARSGDDRQDVPSQRTEQQPRAKQGGKDDLDAIGNRDIGGGRGLGNWYSLEGEIRMGREYAQMIDSTVKLVQDPVITEYVNRIRGPARQGAPEAAAAAGKTTSASGQEKPQRRAETTDGAAPRSADATNGAKARDAAEANAATPSSKARESGRKAALI